MTLLGYQNSFKIFALDISEFGGPLESRGFSSTALTDLRTTQP